MNGLLTLPSFLPFGRAGGFYFTGVPLTTVISVPDWEMPHKPLRHWSWLDMDGLLEGLCKLIDEGHSNNSGA